MTLKRFDGRVVLITGAAGGIGTAIAHRLASEGAAIVATDRDGAGAKALGTSLGGLGFAHDVSNQADWARISAETLARFGRIDGLVNNAGVSGQTAPIADSSIEDWHSVFAINATGAYLGTRFGLQAMQAGAGGAVVNMASLGALKGTAEHAAYCASKAAIVSLSRTAAIEGARGAAKVRVNAVCPGFVDTPAARALLDQTFGDDEAAMAAFHAMIPLGPGHPDDIAASVAFLLSDDARWITGTTFVVDGGMNS